jgi:hypothetical protein
MKRIGLVAVFLLLAVSAFGQQDPLDPGLPDSIILGSSYVDSSGSLTIVSVPIFLVCDDSIIFMHIPVRWESSTWGVHAEPGLIRYPPWDCPNNFGETIHLLDQYVDIVGGMEGDSACETPIFTDEGRFHILDLRFAIEPDAPAQTVILDSTSDSRLGSIYMGLVGGLAAFTPIFTPGQIVVRGAQKAVAGEPNPKAFEIIKSYPNPFNPSTTIEFSLAEGGDVSLAIYDILGRKIRPLYDGYRDAGSYSLVWDGKESSGKDMPSGTYFYRLVCQDRRGLDLQSTGVNVETKKMVLLR